MTRNGETLLPTFLVVILLIRPTKCDISLIIFFFSMLRFLLAEHKRCFEIFRTLQWFIIFFKSVKEMYLYVTTSPCENTIKLRVVFTKIKEFWGKNLYCSSRIVLDLNMLYTLTSFTWRRELDYVVGSKCFRSDQLFKVIEIKQLCYFSKQLCYFST